MQENQQDKENTRDKRASESGSHHQPLQAGGKWADHTAFGVELN
jgi:hypothetical protein